MKKTLIALIISVVSVIVLCSAAYFSAYGATPPCEAALDALARVGIDTSSATNEKMKKALRSFGVYADKTPIECLIELARTNYKRLELYFEKIINEVYDPNGVRRGWSVDSRSD